MSAIYLPDPSTLSTTMPASPGVYWNNGGVVGITEIITPGTADLPTTLPLVINEFWNNGGALSIS